MDAMRKQLDVLMGANRNGDVREVNRKYYDRYVCRLYLVGLCPHELFQLTKMDMGPCPKVHSLQLRKKKTSTARVTGTMIGERSRDRGRESSRDQDRGDSRDQGRDYDRRSRDHDRYNDRDRGYDRERERHSYDSRSLRRSRSRSREHTRDYDRHRRYD